MPHRLHLHRLLRTDSLSGLAGFRMVMAHLLIPAGPCSGRKVHDRSALPLPRMPPKPTPRRRNTPLHPLITPPIEYSGCSPVSQRGRRQSSRFLQPCVASSLGAAWSLPRAKPLALGRGSASADGAKARGTTLRTSG